MITEIDIQKIVESCRVNLNLGNARLGEEYFYQSLPLCVIDAVFSIGVKYASTENVVTRFCDYFGINRIRERRGGYPHKSEQLSISDLIKIYEKYGLNKITDEVYCNRQRTSTRNGILKSEAVFRFSHTLANLRVDYFQDIDGVVGNSDFGEQIMSIPGQRSGISLNYFYMLAGSEDYIKPDRMMSRFISSAINRTLNAEECQKIIVEAHKILVHEFPQLTLRLLDYQIWQYQRER
jgi:hypothetical protein